VNEPVDLLKIGPFAMLAGTNLRTLRYYEELELLSPALRSEGGFRYYRPTDVNRVRMIQNLQSLGLQLERIRELLDTRAHAADREAFARKVAAALEEQQRLIDEQVKDLKAQRAKVGEALEKIHECRVCQHCPAAENNFCEPCQNTGRSLPEFLSALY